MTKAKTAFAVALSLGMAAPVQAYMSPAKLAYTQLAMRSSFEIRPLYCVLDSKKDDAVQACYTAMTMEERMTHPWATFYSTVSENYARSAQNLGIHVYYLDMGSHTMNASTYELLQKCATHVDVLGKAALYPC